MNGQYHQSYHPSLSIISTDRPLGTICSGSWHVRHNIISYALLAIIFIVIVEKKVGLNHVKSQNKWEKNYFNSEKDS